MLPIWGEKDPLNTPPFLLFVTLNEVKGLAFQRRDSSASPQNDKAKRGNEEDEDISYSLAFQTSKQVFPKLMFLFCHSEQSEESPLLELRRFSRLHNTELHNTEPQNDHKDEIAFLSCRTCFGISFFNEDPESSSGWQSTSLPFTHSSSFQGTLELLFSSKEQL